jgi:predicted O-methyltransferase YrrM
MLMEMTGLVAEFDWPHAPTDARRYYTGQNWFPAADAFVLYALLQLMKPKRVIEVGSGYSSALMLDAREFKLRPQPALTFIDPSPERLRTLLRPGDADAATVHAAALQDVPQEIFGGLEAGDFLFVDSSHVSKVGSEVHTILFEIVPALAPGVIVHFHDVFWPFEYPAKWIRSGVAWNESYLLRAFLMFNSAFEVLFWGPYAAAMAPDAAAALGKFRLKESASLWLRRAR